MSDFANNSIVADSGDDPGKGRFVGLGVAILWFVGNLIANCYFEGPGSLFASAVFSLQLIHSCAACYLLKKKWQRYRWIFVGLFSQLGLWSLYLLSFKAIFSMQILSSLFYLSISLVLLASLLVGWLTYCILDESGRGSNHGGKKLLEDIQEHPTLIIFSFLNLFFCVLFFLTFGLAFHDKAEDGLLADYVISRDSNANKQRTIGSSETGALWFQEGTATLGRLSQEVKFDCDKDEPESQLRSRIPLEKCDEEYKDLERFRDCVNSHMICNLVKKIDERSEYERIRITIMGHANDTTVNRKGDRFFSNFEISSARVYHAQYLLNQLLEGLAGKKMENLLRGERKNYNVEWLLSPVANEETFLDSKLVNKYSRLQPKLSAEISVVPIVSHHTELEMRELTRSKIPLTLLDHLYFMVYTITTTGYGDLKPVTAEAKFVTIIANLFEVAFMVIFLNVVISTRRAVA